MSLLTGLTLIAGLLLTTTESSADALECPAGSHAKQVRADATSERLSARTAVTAGLNARCVRDATTTGTNTGSRDSSEQTGPAQPVASDDACRARWLAAYQAWKKLFNMCLLETQFNTLDVTPQEACRQQHPEPMRPAAAPGDAPDPVDVEGLALRAATELKLPMFTPQVGPPPSVNRWNLAFVGYPMWLWTDHSDTLTSTVTLEGVTLTLTAKHTSTMFAMGERDSATGAPFGRAVVCSMTTPWVRNGRPPRTPSPTCGYTYTHASRTHRTPNGVYTITASETWTVTWAVTAATVPVTGGPTAPIVLHSQGITTLPVGELQTVRRR